MYSSETIRSTDNNVKILMQILLRRQTCNVYKFPMVRESSRIHKWWRRITSHHILLLPTIGIRMTDSPAAIEAPSLTIKLSPESVPP